MPSVRLDRGQNTSITNALPGLSAVTIGFSWTVIQGHGPLTEIVPCAIVCGQDGKAISAEHVVFFNQMLTPDESVQYTADGNLPDGDVEQIEVDIRTIPANVMSVVFALYVNPDLRNPGTFESMRQGVVRVLDRGGEEILSYPIDTNDVRLTSAMVAAELYRRGNEWKFRAVGQGYGGGITAVAQDYGFASS